VASFTSGEKPGPFAKPGWIRELFRWAYEQTAPLGLRLTGNFRQYNASPTFSLMRIETDGDALWFKATGEPNAHELSVSLSLARLFPRHVPRILGVHPAWNGWLTVEVSGAELDQTSECSSWERAAEQLAELQIESIGKGAELLEAKCKDLRIRRLVEQIDPYLARMAELMAVQEKPSPAPLSTSELSSLAQGLRESCSLLQDVGLPDTLGHTDFNPGNILVSQDRCVFVDWAEACVTNPLITLEYLCQYLERSAVEETQAVERVTTAYLRPWTSFHSLDDLRRALAVSRLIAVFVYAVATDVWRSSDSLRHPQLAGYLRSLTRRMYREAIHVAERSELCVD
jgi:Ser/Thr protein kinase RdoA (MazF antagonist)